MHGICACAHLLVLLLHLASPPWGALATPPPHAKVAVLRLGQELAFEQFTAPFTARYILEAKSLQPEDELEVRISHSALPPVSFSFALEEFPKDGSVVPDRRKLRHLVRALSSSLLPDRQLAANGSGAAAVAAASNNTSLRRRRLDTSIFVVALGKTGRIVVQGKEHDRALLLVYAKPTGVRGFGVEPSVSVRFNIIAERKMFNNAIPESGVRMAFLGVFLLLGASLLLVPALSRVLRRGDELMVNMVQEHKENKDKEHDRSR
jgi:hypothetical protein